VLKSLEPDPSEQLLEPANAYELLFEPLEKELGAVALQTRLKVLVGS